MIYLRLYNWSEHVATATVNAHIHQLQLDRLTNYIFSFPFTFVHSTVVCRPLHGKHKILSAHIVLRIYFYLKTNAAKKIKLLSYDVDIRTNTFTKQTNLFTVQSNRILLLHRIYLHTKHKCVVVLNTDFLFCVKLIQSVLLPSLWFLSRLWNFDR